MNNFSFSDIFKSDSLEHIGIFCIGVVLAILLKKYLSKVISKLLFILFKKYTKSNYVKQFESTILPPMQGFVVTVFLFIAYLRVDNLINNIILYKRTINKGTAEEAIKQVTLVQFIDSIFYLSLICYFVWLIVRIVDFLFFVAIQKVTELKDRERQQLYPLLRDVLKVIIWAFGILAILSNVFEVNVGTLVAGLGIGGLALAFAAKESVENFIASFMILIDKPFRVGDWIKVNGTEGNVEKLGIRSTLIRTFDKSLVSLPNKRLIDNNLENFSERGERRVRLELGLIYGLSETDIKATKNALKEFIDSIPETKGNTNVFLDSFGDSSVNLLVVYFVKIDALINFSMIKEQINFGIYQILYRYAKGFAYPTQLALSGVEINDVEGKITPPTTIDES